MGSQEQTEWLGGACFPGVGTVASDRRREPRAVGGRAGRAARRSWGPRSELLGAVGVGVTLEPSQSPPIQPLAQPCRWDLASDGEWSAGGQHRALCLPTSVTALGPKLL